MLDSDYVDANAPIATSPTERTWSSPATSARIQLASAAAAAALHRAAMSDVLTDRRRRRMVNSLIHDAVPHLRFLSTTDRGRRSCLV